MELTQLVLWGIDVARKSQNTDMNRVLLIDDHRVVRAEGRLPPIGAPSRWWRFCDEARRMIKSTPNLSQRRAIVVASYCVAVGMYQNDPRLCVCDDEAEAAGLVRDEAARPRLYEWSDGGRWERMIAYGADDLAEILTSVYGDLAAYAQELDTTREAFLAAWSPVDDDRVVTMNDEGEQQSRTARKWCELEGRGALWSTEV